MTDQKDTRPALLILHADGHIELPTARTHREALAIMNLIAKAAEALHERLLDAPLQAPPPPEDVP